MSGPTRPGPAPRPRRQKEQGPQRRPWWHYVVALAAVLVLAGMAWGGYAIWFALAHVRAAPARVSGLVVRLGAKEDTRVQRVLVRTGDEVTEGQVVVRLDDADLEAEVQQVEARLAAQQSELKRAERDLELTIRQSAATMHEAEAQFSAARARLAQAEAEREMQHRQQPDEVRHAEAALASARSELADAEATLRRMEKLFEQGAVSQHMLDSARTDYQVALAGVQAGEAELAVARTKDYQGRIHEQQVATRAAEEKEAVAGLESARTTDRMVALREEEVIARQAAVAEAEAALEAARARLSDAVLRSPVNGIVVRGSGESIKDGEVVETGVPIVTIVSNDVPLSINASVSEVHIGRVREGQPALIRLDAFRRRWFRGRVEKVGRATEFAGDGSSPWMMQSVPLKLSFDPEGADVKHGMTCRVWIDVRKGR